MSSDNKLHEVRQEYLFSPWAAVEVQEKEWDKCSGSGIIVKLRTTAVSETISRYYYKLDEIRYIVYKACGMCGY